MSKRIVIMAGGTGGHVFPALAVAQELAELGWEVSWLGTKTGLESKVVPANKIAIEQNANIGVFYFELTRRWIDNRYGQHKLKSGNTDFKIFRDSEGNI
jgi:hypothetical protein